MEQRLDRLGISGQIEVADALVTPAEPRIGVLLSHRRAIQAASEKGASSLLVLSGEILFRDQAQDILSGVAAELAELDWQVCFLGGRWPLILESQQGSQYLDLAWKVSNLHAVAYHQSIFPKVLADWPSESGEMAEWVERHGGLEDYLGKIERAFVIRPVITTEPALLPFEEPAVQRRFLI